MIKNKKISLVIPCYNEAAGLDGLLKNDLSYIDEIIVVDNNSTDATAQVAKNYGCRVIEEKTKGYGAAYKCGFQHVTNEVVVAMDGDNTYPISEIKRLVGFLIDENLDFISANRLWGGKPKTMKKINYLGNIFLTIVTRLLFFRSLKDSQSGMWVFRKKILGTVKPKSNGMAFSQEIKIEVLKEKYKFAELEIPYKERLGQEKLNSWTDGIKNLIWLFYKRLF